MFSSATDGAGPGSLGGVSPTRTAIEPPPPAAPAPPRAAAGRVNRILATLAWPLAIIAILQRAVFHAADTSTTDDFTTVFSAVRRFVEGDFVYRQDYQSVAPHYLYSPGGTLVLTPLLGWTDDVDASRTLFLWLQVGAIIAAILLLLRWVGVPARSWLTPAAIGAAFLTETVTNTVAFTNVNGLLLLAEVAFLMLFGRGRGIAAGLILGLAITVKPVVAPLLFLPFARRRFAAVAAGVAVPVAANLAAWPLMRAPGEYFTLTVPYLGQVRDYFNVSLAGQFVFFGASPRWLALWQAVIAAIVVLGVALLLRWMDRDPLMWSAATAALLLTGVFLLGSLGQMYYTMLLFPLVATVAGPLTGAVDALGEPARSPMTAWPAVTGLVLCVWYDSFATNAWPLGSYWFDVGRGTIGWILIAAAITGCAVKWTIEDLAAGRPLLPGMAPGGGRRG